MKDFIFSQDGWKEYVSWQTQDRKTIKKINELLDDIIRNGAMEGIGKPEKLKHRPGYSRHIDDKNRLIYDVNEYNDVIIISCRGHYE